MRDIQKVRRLAIFKLFLAQNVKPIVTFRVTDMVKVESHTRFRRIGPELIPIASPKVT